MELVKTTTQRLLLSNVDREYSQLFLALMANTLLLHFYQRNLEFLKLLFRKAFHRVAYYLYVYKIFDFYSNLTARDKLLFIFGESTPVILVPLAAPVDS